LGTDRFDQAFGGQHVEIGCQTGFAPLADEDQAFLAGFQRVVGKPRAFGEFDELIPGAGDIADEADAEASGCLVAR